MSRRIKSTRQAARAREVAVWVLRDKREKLLDNFTMGELWEHLLDKPRIQAILDSRARYRTEPTS